MNINYKRAGCLLMATGGLALVSGCVVEPNGAVAFQPVVIAPQPVYVAPPPPVYEPPVVVAPDVVVTVPDSYTWDGFEYVGFVGGGYFYLGPGNVWLGCEPWRLDRFHGWERNHPDWRDHAIRNDRFRNDRNGHYQPMRDDHGRPGGPQGRPAQKPEKKDDHH